MPRVAKVVLVAIPEDAVRKNAMKTAKIVFVHRKVL